MRCLDLTDQWTLFHHTVETFPMQSCIAYAHTWYTIVAAHVMTAYNRKESTGAQEAIQNGRIETLFRPDEIISPGKT